MKKLSLTIMEILGMSLEVDKSYYKEFFEDGSSLLRCNFYPPCQEPGQTLGTGPHCDPTALTILYQDQVGGLEVFADDLWKSVRPRPGALVVNLGDTFSVSRNTVRRDFLFKNHSICKVSPRLVLTTKSKYKKFEKFPNI